MARVAIFDYGAGNIFSLQNSLRREGATVDVIADFDQDGTYDGLLLPGVGNFDPAIRAITGASKDGFARWTGGGMPVLGICLGMEMFFEGSDEGAESGLGVMRGHVDALPDTIKVPHMGWNGLEIAGSGGRLLEGIPEGSWVYFVHSYMARMGSSMPDDIITAHADYNGIAIPACIEYKNYIGTQFHPEKSGPVGRKMIQNFLGVCRR